MKESKKYEPKKYIPMATNFKEMWIKQTIKLKF